MIENEIESALAADKRQAKDDSLVRIMTTYGITLPANAIEWRVKEAKGTLPAFNYSVTLLVTDGILGWFLLGDGETLFYGHLAAFVPDEKEKVYKGPRKPKVKSKRQQLLDSI